MKLRFSMTGLAVIAIVAGACSSSATTAPSAAAGGGSALLLPSVDAARYEAADQPDFKAKVAELCPTVAYTYNNAAGSAATQQQQAEAAMTNGAKVLVLEACSHHRQAEDLGTVKIPRLFRQLAPRAAAFDFSRDLPEAGELAKYSLVITCGGCMRTRAEVMGQLSRMRTELPESAEPIWPKNWGELNTMTIAFGHGLAVAPMQAMMAVGGLFAARSTSTFASVAVCSVLSHRVRSARVRRRASRSAARMPSSRARSEGVSTAWPR